MLDMHAAVSNVLLLCRCCVMLLWQVAATASCLVSHLHEGALQ